MQNMPPGKTFNSIAKLAMLGVEEDTNANKQFIKFASFNDNDHFAPLEVELCTLTLLSSAP